MALVEDQVQNMIVIYCAADQHPVLTEAEIDLLLAEAKIVDEDGYDPDDPDWTETYNVNYAISKGWEIKAGKCAGSYDFSDLGQKFNRSQMFKHCEAMAKKYRGQTYLALDVPSALTQPLATDGTAIVVEDFGDV